MSNRFRVYDKLIQETFKQEDDYTFRDPQGNILFDMLQVFRQPKMFSIKENTGFQDKNNTDIFEGDTISFRAHSEKTFKTGKVERLRSGKWVITTEDGLTTDLIKPKVLKVVIKEGK